jgi:CDGSH-type Zn-finger protein
MPAEITAYPDGPYLVRGEFRLHTAGGGVERRRKTIALCRCGRSRRKPYCDGTHKLAGFRSIEDEPVSATADAVVVAAPSDDER